MRQSALGELLLAMVSERTSLIDLGIARAAFFIPVETAELFLLFLL